MTDQIEVRETDQLSNEGLPEKVTNNHDDLKLHIESVHKMGKSRLKCKYCPYWTDWMSTMKDHVKAVHQKARFNCGECKFTRQRKRDLMRHIREVHQDGQNGKFVCEDCGYAASKKILLNSHRLYVHELKTKNLTVTNSS